jgi:HPr kinase/phosphorylase
MPVVTPSVTVASLVDDRRGGPGSLSIRLLSGAAGLTRRITQATIQKTGLALAGYDSYLHAGRVLVFGESEVRFLESLAGEARRETLRRVLGHDIPCVLLTGGLAAPPDLLAESDRAGVPILETPVATPVAINRIMALLEDQLAPRELIHGVLLDILGLGVLLVGESGIGKSECALDLVVRGHRLVADDAIEVRRRAGSVVIGTSPELTRHHMELRGIGLINVRDMFGVASTRRSKRVELVVQLERWDPARHYERLGLDDHRFTVIGVPIPFVRMPVAPGRSLAILVEVAARNQLLRARGQHAARALVERADRGLLAGDDAAGEPPWTDEDDR